MKNQMRKITISLYHLMCINITVCNSDYLLLGVTVDTRSTGISSQIVTSSAAGESLCLL